MPISDETHVTIDHETIRNWAEERGGYPATVADSRSGEAAGVLRIGFGEEDELEPISWDEFFDKFEDKALAMRYRGERGESIDDTYHEFLNRRFVTA